MEEQTLRKWHVDEKEIFSSWFTACQRNFLVKSVLCVTRKMKEIAFLKHLVASNAIAGRGGVGEHGDGTMEEDDGGIGYCCTCLEVAVSFTMYLMPCTLPFQGWKYDLYREYATRNNLPVQPYNCCVNDLYIVMATDHYRLNQQRNGFKVPMIPYYANTADIRTFQMPDDFVDAYNDIRRENGDEPDMTTSLYCQQQCRMTTCIVLGVYFFPCLYLGCKYKNERDRFYEENIYQRYITKHNIVDDWKIHPLSNNAGCWDTCFQSYNSTNLSVLYTYRVKRDMESRRMV